MTDFSKLFIKSKGHPIEYKGKTVVLFDKFPVKDGDTLIIKIEKSTSDCRQGLSIDITGHCELNGKTIKEGKGVNMLFWSDTAPDPVILQIFTKQNFVWVENIWEKVNSYSVTDSEGNLIKKQFTSIESRYYGAAMIVEEIKNGRRYRCNDWHPDENFEDIIFTICKQKQIIA